MMHAHINEPAKRPSAKVEEIPKALDDLVVALMAKDPNDRPWDARPSRRSSASSWTRPPARSRSRWSGPSRARPPRCPPAPTSVDPTAIGSKTKPRRGRRRRRRPGSPPRSASRSSAWSPAGPSRRADRLPRLAPGQAYLYKNAEALMASTDADRLDPGPRRIPRPARRANSPQAPYKRADRSLARQDRPPRRRTRRAEVLEQGQPHRDQQAQERGRGHLSGHLRGASTPRQDPRDDQDAEASGGRWRSNDQSEGRDETGAGSSWPRSRGGIRSRSDDPAASRAGRIAHEATAPAQNEAARKIRRRALSFEDIVASVRPIPMSPAWSPRPGPYLADGEGRLEDPLDKLPRLPTLQPRGGETSKRSRYSEVRNRSLGGRSTTSVSADREPGQGPGLHVGDEERLAVGRQGRCRPPTGTSPKAAPAAPRSEVELEEPAVLPVADEAGVPPSPNAVGPAEAAADPLDGRGPFRGRKR